MKKLTLIILATMLLSGCGLNNQQIIQEVELCEKANLHPRALKNMNNDIMKIQCEPLTPQQ